MTNELPSRDKLEKLRVLITENLRVQQYGADNIRYIDANNAVSLMKAKQNHAVFARRGCGKTLLLATAARAIDIDTKVVYLNCEDFKEHSFPNVLIEILDAVLRELQTKQNAWFGKKKRAKEIIEEIRARLSKLRVTDDERQQLIKQTTSDSAASSDGVTAEAALSQKGLRFRAGASATTARERTVSTQAEYTIITKKIEELNQNLPDLKRLLKEFFELSGKTKIVFLHLDDFYHLKRSDQPHVADYIHRLCKDLPMYFKIATLRHSSVLFLERSGQPIGAQERHDYQPINIDFTFEDLKRTENQNWRIFQVFAGLAGIAEKELNNLFKGEGFRRLILAGGGVPRDCLSLFLEVLDTVQERDGRIGKDDVRILSLSTFERRIEDLKQDSQSDEQDNLLRGIHAIREFCLSNKSNVFCVEESLLRNSAAVQTLLYKLLDYRIIHSVATAITHKTHTGGTYRAFAIDIGCYAFLRKMHGKMREIDFADPQSKESCRSAPVLVADRLQALFDAAPADVEGALRENEA